VPGLYSQLVTQEITRYQMIETLAKKYQENNSETSTRTFLESLSCISMESEVRAKMKEHLMIAINDVKDRIIADIFNDDEMLALAHSLGQRELFNSMAQPTESDKTAVSDQEALLKCLETWTSQTTQSTNTDDFLKCLKKARLSEISKEICKKLAQVNADDDIESFVNMDIRDTFPYSS